MLGIINWIQDTWFDIKSSFCKHKDEDIVFIRNISDYESNESGYHRECYCKKCYRLIYTDEEYNKECNRYVEYDKEGRAFMYQDGARIGTYTDFLAQLIEDNK